MDTSAQIPARFDASAIREYRTTMEDLIRLNEELIAASGRTETAGAAQRALALVQSLPDADVTRLMLMGADFTELRDRTAALRDLVGQGVRPAMKVGTHSAGFPDAPYSPLLGSEHNGSEIMIGAQAALDLAKSIWAGLDRGCNQVVVTPAGGGNTSLACITADVALHLAEGVYRGFEFKDADIDSADIRGSYLRLAHIHTDLENARADIIANDNANRDLVLRELRALTCDVIRLLNTPEGQRSSAIGSCAGQPAFPYEFPEKKIP